MFNSRFNSHPSRLHTGLASWSAWLNRFRYGLLALLLLLWVSGMAFVVLDPRSLTVMQAGGASHSDAAQVQEALKDYFDLGLESSLALVLEAGHTAPPALMQKLRAFPHVERVEEIPGAHPHRNHVYYIQLDPHLPIFETENQVPLMRQMLADWSQESGIKTWITGKQAFFYDMGQASKQETSHAEHWGLLLAFVVLIFNFGSLAAAALPLVVGTSTLLLTQVLLHLLSLGSNQTSLVLDSMVGLGLTIDYCLFMVNRYREERQHTAPAAAMAIVLMRTGRTILYSALVMLAALFTLLIPEVDALRGTVQNLLLVVSLSAFNALFTLPLLLLVMDPWLDRPRWLAERILSWHNELRWRRLASHITQHAVFYFLLSLSLLLALAAPVTRLKLWEPLQSLAPESSESIQGFKTLAADNWGGEVMPIVVLIYAPPGQSVLDDTMLAQIYDLMQNMEKEPEVAWTQGIVSTAQPLESYQMMLGQMHALSALLQPKLPLVRQTPQGEATLVNIYPQDVMDVGQAYRILEHLQDYQASHPQFKMQVGGIVARARSFTHEMYKDLPLLLALVLGSILLLLSAYLRSLILPLKAGIMNFLPILSAFGIMVWAFQWGGIKHHEGIINIVPITLFCIVFGLSMDYEVLILSRIDEAWREHGDVREAVISGLARSAGIITGAALILLGIFSMGLSSASPIVQELSLGITATIFLDATLVRLLLVPAFMMLMGKWNWWHPSFVSKKPE